MKIIHVVWNMSYGGAETLLVQLLNHQCNFHDVDLVIVNNVIEKDLIDRIDKRVTIHTIGRPLHNRNPFYFMKLSILLLFVKSDIVHFHQDDLIEYIPARFFKKNFCLTVHSVVMDAKSLYKYNHLFAISQSVREAIKKSSGRDSLLIYNGIDFKQFNRKPDKSCRGKKWDLIQIGRLDCTIKGQHLLLQAACQLIRKYRFTGFRIHFFGDGVSKDYLHTLVNELELKDFVSFEGSQSYDFIRQNLYKYDLLVQPSLYEGFGLVAIEGMAAGIPVLVSNINGLAEIVRQDRYGYSFEQNNVEDLADKIYEIIHAPQEKLDALTSEAYQYAIENYNINMTSENYLKAYRKIIES